MGTGVEGQAPQRTIGFICQIVLYSISLRQWLHQEASVLKLTFMQTALRKII